MADNLAVTPGSGATVAADDIGGVLYQRIKLGLGADGTAVDAVAGAGAVGTGVQRVTLASDDPAVASLQLLDNAIAGNEMQVDVVAALPAGTNVIGRVGIDQTTPGTTDRVTVGGKKARVSATFARPADTTAYAAGDVVSNSTSATTLMTFAGAARLTGGSGYVVGVRLVTDKKSITPRFRLHLFNASNPTVSADNAAHRAVYADESKRVAVVDIPSLSTPADTTNSDVSVGSDHAVRVPYVCAADANLYGFLEALDAFTPASGENFSLTLVTEQD